MALIINIFMAWLAVIFMVLLVVVYGFRLWIKNSTLPKNHPIRRWNRTLRKSHKWLALIAILSGFVHGLYSSVAILSTNKGTILWVIFLLLGFSYYLRKVYSKKLPWVKVHRVLALASLVFLVLHVVEVGGFVGVDPVMNAFKTLIDSPKETEPLSEKDAEASHVQGHKGQQNKAGNGLNDFDEILILSEVADGRYMGGATGYGPGLKVSVSVEDGKIIDVVVLEHNEVNQRFWGLPVELIPKAIVEEQLVKVDIVSGATMTSRGIMNAVRDALTTLEVMPEGLSEATTLVEMETTGESQLTEETSRVTEDIIIEIEATKASEPQPIDTTKPSMTPITTVAQSSKETIGTRATTTIKTVVETTVEFTTVELPTTTVPTTVVTRTVPNDSLWNDGIYRGEATGFNDGLVVEVTIQEGIMTKIRVVRHNEEGTRYWGRPVQEIPPAIVAAQSTNVDIISGASYTSRGIMKAVENALQEALK